MDDETARLECLKLATANAPHPDQVLRLAESYLNWIFAKIVVEPTKA